jgi:microcystin-dependent protein
MALVKLQSDMYSNDQQKIFLGHVMGFPDTTIPSGYIKCNGAPVSRTTYADLFALIGTTFGVGDGSTTFNVPDLRGEFIRGLDDLRGVDVGRTINTFQDHQANPFNTIDTNTTGSSTTSVVVPQNGTASPYMGFFWDNEGIRFRNSGGEARPVNYALTYCIRY